MESGYMEYVKGFHVQPPLYSEASHPKSNLRTLKALLCTYYLRAYNIRI